MKHHFDMVENHFKIKKGVKNHFIPVKNHTMNGNRSLYHIQLARNSEGVIPVFFLKM